MFGPLARIRKNLFRVAKNRTQTSFATWQSSSLEKQMDLSVFNCFTSSRKAAFEDPLSESSSDKNASIQEKPPRLVKRLPSEASTPDTWEKLSGKTLFASSVSGSSIATGYSSGCGPKPKQWDDQSWMSPSFLGRVLQPKKNVAQSFLSTRSDDSTDKIDDVCIYCSQHERVTSFVLNVAQNDGLSALNGDKGFSLIAQTGPDDDEETQYAVRLKNGFYLQHEWITQGYMDKLVCEVKSNCWQDSSASGSCKYLKFKFEPNFYLFNPTLETHATLWKDWIANPRHASRYNRWDTELDTQGKSKTERMKQGIDFPYHEQFYLDHNFGAIITCTEEGAFPQISLTDIWALKPVTLHYAESSPATRPASASSDGSRTVFELA